MITFLKLGGSLITDKDRAHTARPDVINRLAREIRSVWDPERDLLLIGHGSGSFGHIPAKKYGTRTGVKTEEEWRGFAEVHAEAAALNRIVTDILREADLPVLSLVPMDNIRTADGSITFWDTEIIEKILANHLIPMVFGDTVFDSVRGGTILSTEDLFIRLCTAFCEPPRILLAGLEEGVWKDFPLRHELLKEISSGSDEDDDHILGSASVDVTGGMSEKVRLMKSIVREKKAGSAVIFSGEVPGNLQKILSGENIGTRIV